MQDTLTPHPPYLTKARIGWLTGPILVAWVTLTLPFFGLYAR